MNHMEMSKIEIPDQIKTTLNT